MNPDSMPRNPNINGFGTHNFWVAFRGWLWAKLRGKKVRWRVVRSKSLYDWHVVDIDES